MYAPDMVFSYKFSKNIKKEKKSIGISVINLSIRDNLKELEAIYNDFIKRIVIKFAKRNYKVYLLSFSEFEKDTEAINNIIDLLPEQYKDSIEIIKFNSNIEEYLEKYAKIQYMVSSRFHSMVLSILFNQKLYNLTYSKKQDNVIEELKLFSRYQQINNLKYVTVLRDWYFKRVSKSKLKKISSQAEEQFINLDNWVANEL